MTGNSAFHQRCMRKILGVCLQDKATNTEALEKTGQQTVETTQTLD